MAGGQINTLHEEHDWLCHMHWRRLEMLHGDRRSLTKPDKQAMPFLPVTRITDEHWIVN